MEKQESSAGKPESSEKLHTKSRMVIKSSTAIAVSQDTENRPSPLHFETYMPWICKQFQMDVIIQVVSQTQNLQGLSLKLKRGKKSDTIIVHEDAVTATTASDTKAKTSMTSTAALTEKGGTHRAIQILVTHDHNHNLIKINLHNNKEVPRTLLIILSLIVKFYPALTTLTVNSGINVYSIYEMSKCLTESALKEICVDGTRIKNPNYHLLLEKTSHLACLSLARCQIGDEALKKITDLLDVPFPASKTLTYLNISSNNISNKGAAYLAKVLRTNRKLACLNLADNNISDTGASYIFDILLYFPISDEEMVQSIFRHLKYINQKTALVAKFMAEVKTTKETRTTKKKYTQVGTKIITKTNGLEIKDSMREIKTIATVAENKNFSVSHDKYAEMADSRATNALGEYKDPFQSPASFTKNGISYCTGNTVLASLNLSYNNLSYVTLNKLLKVLNWQKDIMQKPRGLFRVIMDGNNLPINCEEYTEINELLNSSLDFHHPGAKKRAGVK